MPPSSRQRPSPPSDHSQGPALDALAFAPSVRASSTRSGAFTRNLTRRADSDSSVSVNPSALFDLPAPLASLHAQLGTSGSHACDAGGGVAVDTRAGGYRTNGFGDDGTRYCADSDERPRYVWWQSNMDIDCDGSDGSAEVCQGDGSFQPDTAFRDDEGKNIDAQAIQYVVIDQDADFDPTSFGIQPLSVVAVVCGGKLTFGVWADTNALGSMGEASVRLGRVCFGSQINGHNGHGEPDVLYLAFPGSKDETVPAGYGRDEDAMFQLGRALVGEVFGAEEGGGATTSSLTDTTSVSTLPSSGTSSASYSSTITNTTEHDSSSTPATHTVPASSSLSTSSLSTSSLSTSSLSTSSLSPSPTPGDPRPLPPPADVQFTLPVLILCAGVALVLAAAIVACCVRRAPAPRCYDGVSSDDARLRKEEGARSTSGSSGRSSSETGSSDDAQDDEEEDEEDEDVDEKGGGERSRLYGGDGHGRQWRD
ncbi:hypothetical protein JCM3770_002009 [Rhodotorula araucariae]